MHGQTEKTDSTAFATSVLLVDDDAGYRDLLSQQLSLLGCIVRSVSSASEFLAQIAETPEAYDLAVVDMGLPDLGGGDVISWLDQSEVQKVSRMPILVVTGRPNTVVESSPTSRNLIEFVFKPHKFDELASAVCRLVA